MPTTVDVTFEGHEDFPRLHDKYVEVERRLCEHFGVEPDPKYWFRQWYDNIPGMIAFGCDDLRDTWSDTPDILEILDWFDDNGIVFNHGGWRPK